MAARRYDAIVIGAGNGGLSAAVTLANKGHEVLLLERHNVPGGYATSFVRGRYEFEIALHQLSGIGPPGRRGALYRYFEEIGVADRLEFLHMKHFHRSVFPDLDLTLPVGREAYEQAVCEAFPHEADGVRRYLRRMFEFLRGIRFVQRHIPMDGSPPSLSALARAGKAKTLFRYLLSTVEQVMDKDISDPKLKAVLAQTWMYYGLPPSRGAYAYFGSGTADFIDSGPAYVNGRSQAMSSALAARVEELGGEVRCNCGVRRVTTRDGRVTGVITETDEFFETGCVVSNASPFLTCRDMIGADVIPPAFWKRLRSTTIGPSAINLFLGLARSAEDLGLDDVAFLNQDYDLDGQWERSRHITPPSTFMVTCHNVVLPGISPPGTAIVNMTTMSYGEAWLSLDPSEYIETKTRLAEGILATAEKTYPGLRDAIEVIEVATPVTKMRYTGAPGGAIYGFDEPPTEVTVFRLPQKGPIGGLYFAGAWTQSGGGFEPTFFSGRNAGLMAARAVARGAEGGAS